MDNTIIKYLCNDNHIITIGLGIRSYCTMSDRISQCSPCEAGKLVSVESPWFCIVKSGVIL